MKNTLYLSLIGASLFAASCSTASKVSSVSEEKTLNINAKSETNTQGTVKLTEKNNAVEMEMKVYKLTPGIHAVHIHEFGDCSATDATSAGGHWNPSGEMHGEWEKDEFHMGDIGNLVADKDGTAKLIFKTDKWCLSCDDDKKKITGKSIVIHADKDDFKSQPSGNAGGRIGCVEIK